MAKRATEVVTGKIRFSYIALVEPRGFNGADEKYSASLLIPKSDTATINKVQAAIEAAAEKGRADGKIKGKAFKRPLRDGDNEEDTMFGKEGYAGHFFLNASNRKRPGLVDRSRNDMRILPTEELEDEVYSGMYGRAALQFYAYNSNGNIGIACSLQHVQKLDDGERLDGGSSAESAFDDGFEDDDLLG